MLDTARKLQSDVVEGRSVELQVSSWGRGLAWILGREGQGRVEVVHEGTRVLSANQHQI